MYTIHNSTYSYIMFMFLLSTTPSCPRIRPGERRSTCFCQEASQPPSQPASQPASQPNNRLSPDAIPRPPTQSALDIPNLSGHLNSSLAFYSTAPSTGSTVCLVGSQNFPLLTHAPTRLLGIDSLSSKVYGGETGILSTTLPFTRRRLDYSSGSLSMSQTG